MLIPIETLSLFVAASVALAVAPGPDNIFVLTQAALNGRVAGLLVTVGLCTGILFHTAAVAAGVATIFATSALAFTALKICGALYLIYLAWGAFRASGEAIAPSGGAVPRRGLYLRGVVMNVTNPKVAIFFLAFLPQFADPERGSVTLQILLLGAVFMASTLVVFGSVAWFSGYVGEWLRRSPTAQTVMNRIAGAIFLALAVRLLATER